MEAADYKCPNCSAHLQFNPKNQKWDCEYCGSSFILEDLKKNEEKFKEKKVKIEKRKEKEYEKEMDLYSCPNCGAKIITERNTSSTFCVYCKSTALLKDKLTGVYAPSKIIPFKNTKDDAIEAFKKIGKKKFLMPKAFTDPKNISEMTGIYIPFWLYDCLTEGTIEGTAQRIKTWSSGDYTYTKTDTYLIKRGGTIETDGIPQDGSIRFDDAIMQSIEPFDYKELKDFNISYLSGFLSEKYDVTNEEAYKNVKERAEQSLLEILESQISSYNTHIIKNKTFETTKAKDEYVLLPVWMLNIKYKDKMYTFAMNGQTGKMIGDIPYSKTKAFIYFLILFAICLIVLALITWWW